MASVRPTAPSSRAWARRLWDFLLPPRCAGCRRRGDWLCATCRAALTPLTPPCCPSCAGDVPVAGLCRHCQARPPAYDRVWAAYRFDDPLRAAIHRFKYGGEAALGEPLGALLADRLAAAPPAADLILAVPLHGSRQRERGYNQSHLLARVVARRLHRPLTDGLVRVRPTMPQVGQNPDSRRANVAGAFAWRGALIAGQRLVLVDDVCTTGATFDACAQALRPHQPASIVAVALARA